MIVGVELVRPESESYVDTPLLDTAAIPVFGIGGWWTLFVLTLHTVWSVAVSVALAEALVPSRRTEPWLGKIGLTVVALLYLLGLVINFFAIYSRQQFVASVPRRGLAASGRIARMTDLTTSARELLGADAMPLEGGYSGETFLVGAAGEQAVLRLYRREPERAMVDTALLQLVRGILPVPRVLDARPPVDGDPAYLLTERLPGVRLEAFLAREPEPGPRARAGSEAGRLLALLSGMPFAISGRFVVTDSGLAVSPWPPGIGALPEWVESNRANGRLAAWSADEIGRLTMLAVDAQAGLDTLDRVCLVHSDFNPKNLLVDPGSGTITGLVDWEYAHAGMPHSDLGNLLRFETDEPFCRAVVAAYRDRAPTSPESTAELLRLARAADLFALVDLAARERSSRITELAAGLLRRMVRENDLAAGRPAWD